jgi:hypothetical protein
MSGATHKGKRVAAMFVLFHQRICGALASSKRLSLFPSRRDSASGNSRARRSAPAAHAASLLLPLTKE